MSETSREMAWFLLHHAMEQSKSNTNSLENLGKLDPIRLPLNKTYLSRSTGTDWQGSRDGAAFSRPLHFAQVYLFNMKGTSGYEEKDAGLYKRSRLRV